MKAQGGGKGGGGKGGGGTGKDFSKLLPQGSMKAADQEESQDGLLPTRGNSLAPSSSSSSSNSNLAPIIIISKPGGKKPLFSDNKSKSNFKIENRQVFPGKPPHCLCLHLSTGQFHLLPILFQACTS